MISRKSRYALRALLLLASLDDRATLQISEIAKQERIPPKFLEQILLELKKAGLLRSRRGRNGGYSLARPARGISIADVLQVTDSSLALSPCVSMTAHRPCKDCFDEQVCAIRRALLAAQNATAAILGSRDLAAAAELQRGTP